jgi:hypothetical protein
LALTDMACESPPSRPTSRGSPSRQIAARAMIPESTIMPVIVRPSAEMLVAPAPKPKSGSVVSVRVTPS